MKLLSSIYKAWKLRNLKADKGENVIIEIGSFSNSQNIKISNNVYIGPGAFWNGLGGIEIHENVIIGPKSIIWTCNHNYNSDKLLPYDEIEILKKVVIEKNVWVGLNVSIAPGVHINEGAIIGLGSVVVNDIPALAIAAGNPAKVIKYRNRRLYEEALSKEANSYLEAKIKQDLKKQYK
jgi:maltose O-acetyltransferase